MVYEILSKTIHGAIGLVMNDKYLIKRIIALALKIKETDNLTEVVDELKKMELEKMFTTKEGKYYRLNN